MDLAAIKQRTRSVWGQGNYRELSKLLEPAASDLVDACGIGAGQEVLDVAAGDGNFALLAARRGAQVVASDISPGMVERGRSRFAAEGVEAAWVEADAEALPFGDDRFDFVGTVFGAMFAPRPEVAAAELLRVVKPGGIAAMANWTPRSTPARMFEIVVSYIPRPEGVPVPSRWGDPERARELLEPYAASVEFERRRVPFSWPSPEAAWGFFQQNAPTQVAQRGTLDPEREAQLDAEGVELFRQRSRAADGSVEIDAEYLLVVARKPG